MAAEQSATIPPHMASSIMMYAIKLKLLRLWGKLHEPYINRSMIHAIFGRREGDRSIYIHVLTSFISEMVAGKPASYL